MCFDVVLEYILFKGVDENGMVKFEVWVVVKFIIEVFLWVGYSVNVDIILDWWKGVIVIKECDVFFEEDIIFVEIEVGDC